MVYIIIGLQKTGSTSLYSWLSKHRDENLYVNESLKDVHFLSSSFNRNSALSKEERRRLTEYLSIDTKAVYCGVNYWKDRALIQELSALGVKFLLILRHPIDRSYSAFKYFHKLNQTDGTFGEYISEFMASNNDPLDILSGSSYSDFLNFCNDEQIDIKLFDYGEFGKSINGVPLIYLKVCKEIGVLPQSQKFKVLNYSGKERKWLKMVLFGDNSASKKIKSLVKRIIPRNIQKRIYFISRDIIVKPAKEKQIPISAEQMEYLNTYFSNEIACYRNLKHGKYN